MWGSARNHPSVSFVTQWLSQTTLLNVRHCSYHQTSVCRWSLYTGTTASSRNLYHYRTGSHFGLHNLHQMLLGLFIPLSKHSRTLQLWDSGMPQLSISSVENQTSTLHQHYSNFGKQRETLNSPELWKGSYHKTVTWNSKKPNIGRIKTISNSWSVLLYGTSGPIHCHVETCIPNLS